MAFKNPKFRKRVKENPCEWCGWKASGRDAVHIIDQKDVPGSKEWNALSLCPNCHRIFDEVLRPKLYNALIEYGAVNLPKSWAKSNKLA